MKTKLILILFFFSKSIFGQNQEYKSKYVINSGTELILADYSTKKEMESTSIRLTISQNNQALPFVKVKYQDSLKIYSVLTDEEGVVNLVLPAGEFKFEVISPIFKTYLKEIQLQANEEII